MSGPAPEPRSDTRGASSNTLVTMLYRELHALATSRMRGRANGHTLQPTALVHETFLRLQSRGRETWDGRRHFFGAAARAMHDILVEHARARQSLKRGGDVDHEPLDEAEGKTIAITEPDVDMLALSEALDKLELFDPRKHELVMLRYFAGLEHQEIANLLGVSQSTVERDWRFARAWLKSAMSDA